MTHRRPVLPAAVLIIVVHAMALAGCAVVNTTADVVGTAASTAVGVTGTVVKTGADLATAPLRD